MWDHNSAETTHHHSMLKNMGSGDASVPVYYSDGQIESILYSIGSKEIQRNKDTFI